MKELEVIKIDSKDYFIMREVEHDDVIYLFLSNKEDANDMMIRKVKKDNEDLVLPLDSDKEFELACGLLFKDTKRY